MKPLHRALRRRDSAAWEALYTEHTRDVYGVVYRLMGGHRQAVEDVFQTVWMEALNGIEKFDPKRGELRQWLLGIARRQVAMHWRKKLTADFVPMPPDHGHEGIDAAILPDEVIEQMERADVVLAAMLILPADRRQVLTEKYVHGLSVEQIAERSGRSQKAVESLLTRAREQLRSLLQWYFTRQPEAIKYDHRT